MPPSPAPDQKHALRMNVKIAPHLPDARVQLLFELQTRVAGAAPTEGFAPVAIGARGSAECQSEIVAHADHRQHFDNVAFAAPRFVQPDDQRIGIVGFVILGHEHAARMHLRDRSPTLVVANLCLRFRGENDLRGRGRAVRRGAARGAQVDARPLPAEKPKSGGAASDQDENRDEVMDGSFPRRQPVTGRRLGLFAATRKESPLGVVAPSSGSLRLWAISSIGKYFPGHAVALMSLCLMMLTGSMP